MVHAAEELDNASRSVTMRVNGVATRVKNRAIGPGETSLSLRPRGRELAIDLLEKADEDGHVVTVVLDGRDGAVIADFDVKGFGRSLDRLPCHQ